MNWMRWMAFVVMGLAAQSALGADAKMTPREILDKVDDLYRGDSAHGTMSMKVVTEHWTREMKVEFWSEGKEKTLFRILAPRKERGTATLKSGKNIWNYLPKVKRVIKVPSSMMGGSWMGSHFTNDDLVKESRMADDYDFETSFEGERDGHPVVEITCTPKPGAAVVWGKVTVEVRRDIFQPTWMKYYDEDMELARTMTFTGVKKLDDRTIPTTARMVPSDKPGEYTLVSYEDIEFNLELSDRLFTLRNLQR